MIKETFMFLDVFKNQSPFFPLSRSASLLLPSSVILFRFLFIQFAIYNIKIITTSLVLFSLFSNHKNRITLIPILCTLSCKVCHILKNMQLKTKKKKMQWEDRGQFYSSVSAQDWSKEVPKGWRKQTKIATIVGRGRTSLFRVISRTGDLLAIKRFII